MIFSQASDLNMAGLTYHQRVEPRGHEFFQRLMSPVNQWASGLGYCQA
jgi:hypothetical protein